MKKRICLIWLVIVILLSVISCYAEPSDTKTAPKEFEASESPLSSMEVQPPSEMTASIEYNIIKADVYNDVDVDQYMDLAIPETPPYTHIKRPGYQETEIIFIEDNNGKEYDDSNVYDEDGNIISKDYQIIAQEAMQCLYDMTGFQVDQVEAMVSNGDKNFLSLLQFFGNSNVSPYYRISVDNRTGRIISMDIYFDILVNESAAISMDTLMNPTGDPEASPADITKWYMEHSSMVDWYRLESIDIIEYITPLGNYDAGLGIGQIQCNMEGGGYYKFLQYDPEHKGLNIGSAYKFQLTPLLKE